MSQSSVIGAGTVVRGNLEGEGSLEVYGRVEGDVTMTGDVAVAEGGVVRGQITAASISVSGSVQGDLRGSQAVLLERGARVKGDLTAPRIGIGTGALVSGSVRTEGEPALGQNRRAPSPNPNPPALKPTVFAGKPVVKAEPKPPLVALREAPPRETPQREAPPLEAVAQPLARPPEKPAERRPPPPVLPSLGKGAKAKKKKGRDE